MGKYYRYRLPNVLCKCISLIERAIIPLLIFQLIRTIIFLSFLEVFILTLLIILFIIFYIGLL
ncbi:MAG TPA: hypothetical protein VK075_07115 [Pseudogracilibacillus sp.]|nr:hypothetical protein [Pseudogracilibacillus sp.]